MTFIKIRQPVLLLMVISGFMLGSCQDRSTTTPAPEIDDFISLTPQVIRSIDHTGDLYFSHIGYEGVVLDNGDIAFGDRQIPAIVVINESGELQKEIQEGRGPGEILDAYRFTKDTSGNIYTFDQKNDKIIVYDEGFELNMEFIPPKYENTNVLKVYASGEDQFLFELTSFEYLRDRTKDRENILIQYDPKTESYGEELILKGQSYARLIIDGEVRGASKVPYASGNITAYNAEEGTIFVFDTATDRIAEINSELDTVRTIPVNLPRERISDAELDSMQAAYSDLKWDAVKKLLPETKAPANKMIYHEGEFWFKSNIEADTEIWMVTDEEGVINRVVHLPKESMLLYIVEDHLGVRLDDVTFALFTNPKPEPKD